jgi:hypothetical protein
VVARLASYKDELLCPAVEGWFPRKVVVVVLDRSLEFTWSAFVRNCDSKMRWNQEDKETCIALCSLAFIDMVYVRRLCMCIAIEAGSVTREEHGRPSRENSWKCAAPGYDHVLPESPDEPDIPFLLLHCHSNGRGMSEWC